MKTEKIFMPILTMLILSACTSVEKFDYAASGGIMPAFAGNSLKSVTVLPFLDQRSLKDYEPSRTVKYSTPKDRNAMALGFIPLVITGYTEKEYPEQSEDFVTIKRFDFNPSYDLQSAAVLSLKSSKLFSDVKTASQKGVLQTDYTLEGTLFNSYYNGGYFAYGVTYMIAAPFWILGAPMGMSYNELGIKFKLLDNRTGAEVWNYTYRGHDSCFQWLYGGYGRDVSMYAEMMKKAMGKAVFELNEKLKDVK